MPETTEILVGLHSIANDYYIAAICWHIAFYLLIGLMFTKWKPTNKIFGFLLCLPLLSVAVVAWSSGNPFNGFLFSILTILIFIFVLKIGPGQLSAAETPFLIIGIIMVVFGLLYPHFIDTDSFISYMFVSPAGLIPCPTLSIIIGFALIFNGFGSRSMSFILVGFGLFYGFFGVLKLAVYLDLFLVLGVISLFIKLSVVKNRQ